LIQKSIHWTYKTARRVAIAVLGSTIIAIGIVMIVAPGPALIVIPIGLAVLGIEFTFARRWLKSLRETISNGMAGVRARRAQARRDRVQG
jgi:tellurite resistance protein TerC